MASRVATACRRSWILTSAHPALLRILFHRLKRSESGTPGFFGEGKRKPLDDLGSDRRSSTAHADSATGQALTEGLPDPKTRPPEEALLDESELTRLVGLLDDLDERESKILRLRYGLDGEEPLTLKQIGVRIRLTRERVRQIECEALIKIKSHILD